MLHQDMISITGGKRFVVNSWVQQCSIALDSLQVKSLRYMYMYKYLHKKLEFDFGVASAIVLFWPRSQKLSHTSCPNCPLHSSHNHVVLLHPSSFCEEAEEDKRPCACQEQQGSSLEGSQSARRVHFRKRRRRRR